MHTCIHKAYYVEAIVVDIISKRRDKRSLAIFSYVYKQMLMIFCYKIKNTH